MKVGAHQLGFCPWEGFWNKVLSSDVFVIYTGLQFTRKDYHHRAVWPDNNQFFTVPVSGVNSGNGGVSIKDVCISDHKPIQHAALRLKKWAKSKRAPYGERLAGIISILENTRSPFLIDLNLSLFFEILLFFKAKVHIDVDSRTNWKDGPAVMINEMLERNKASVYMAGSGTPDYIKREDLCVEKVLMQKCSPFAPSILHMIGQVDNPLEYLMNNSAVWTEWE